MPHALRSTRVLTPAGLVPATILVDGERIADLREWGDKASGAELHDFGDSVLLPGLVDTHVHINEPGRTEWEGFATATQAAAAGGVTTLVDMPLNCVPEIIDVPALEAKRAAAQGKTWVDWAAWGGLVGGNGQRGNAEALQPLARAGVLGFKCFLIHSGIDGFAWVDEADLRLALAKLRGTGLPLLAHAEVAGPVDAATAELNAQHAGWRKYSTYLASRPDAAEVEAIALLIRLAEEFQTPIHIVHLATAGALPLLAEARKRGVPITVETCVHYLWFAAEEIPDGATEYKCAPPIRTSPTRDALWKALLDGVVDFVATDHSPCLPEMKRQMRLPTGPEHEEMATKTASNLAAMMDIPQERIGEVRAALAEAVRAAVGSQAGRFDLAWGGIASLGLALPVMATATQKRGIALDRLGQWLSAAPARLAGLSARKGALAPGFNADIAVFDPDATWTVTPADLHFRHKISPYLGAELRGRVRETWLRGAPIYRNGEFLGTARGKEQVRP